MQDIDFLPAEYRVANAQRRTHMWRVVVVAIGLGCVISGASYDYFQRSLLKSQLNAAEKRYQASQLLGLQISQLEQELFAAQDEAHLFAYLDHPWPRSQILAAIVGPLPKDIYLERLTIAYRAAPRAISRRDNVRGPQKKPTEEQVIVRKADADLQELRKLYDEQDLIVTLAGMVEDEANLHNYLARLELSDWFIATELNDIQRDEHEGMTFSHFRVELTVRPGYGQADEPRLEPAEIASVSNPLAGGATQ